MNLPMNLTGKRVLVAGCGGGYDVVCGLPVALQLARMGNTVHLGSNSFTDLTLVAGTERVGDGVLIGPVSSCEGYGPEVRLARWLALYEPRISPKILCYRSLAVQPLKRLFNAVAGLWNLDALVIVDGGVDGLFRGDEHDLGSPTIDAMSMMAGTLCGIPEKHYVVTAFGTEGVNKEVSHAEALARIAEVAQRGKLWGSCSLVASDEVAVQFQQAVEFLYKTTETRHQSNMVGSLLAALRGEFGDQPVTVKTVNAPVWVSPLTSVYWFLDLPTTARLKLYFEALENSEDYFQASEVLQAWTRAHSLKVGPKPAIPI